MVSGVELLSLIHAALALVETQVCNHAHKIVTVIGVVLLSLIHATHALVEIQVFNHAHKIVMVIGVALPIWILVEYV